MEPGRGRSRPPWRDASGAGDLWRLCQAVYMATIPTWLGGVGGAAIPTSGAVGGCGAQRPAAGLFYRKSVPRLHAPTNTNPVWPWRVGGQQQSRQLAFRLLYVPYPTTPPLPADLQDRRHITRALRANLAPPRCRKTNLRVTVGTDCLSRKSSPVKFLIATHQLRLMSQQRLGKGVLLAAALAQLLFPSHSLSASDSARCSTLGKGDCGAGFEPGPSKSEATCLSSLCDGLDPQKDRDTCCRAVQPAKCGSMVPVYCARSDMVLDPLRINASCGSNPCSSADLGKCCKPAVPGQAHCLSMKPYLCGEGYELDISKYAVVCSGASCTADDKHACCTLTGGRRRLQQQGTKNDQECFAIASVHWEAQQIHGDSRTFNDGLPILRDRKHECFACGFASLTCQQKKYWHPEKVTENNVDCQGSRGPWGKCTDACGNGTQTRFLAITRSAQNNGTKCTHRQGHTQLQPCSITAPKPINGQFVDTSVEQMSTSVDGKHATFRLYANLKGPALSIYSIVGSEKGRLNLPPAFQAFKGTNTKTPVSNFGGADPDLWKQYGLFDAQFDSWLTVGIEYDSKSRLSSVIPDATFKSWSPSRGLSLEDAGVFWMDPTDTTKISTQSASINTMAGRPVLLAQLTLAIPCLVGWTATMGLVGKTKTGKMWRDDRIQWALTYIPPKVIPGTIQEPCQPMGGACAVFQQGKSKGIPIGHNDQRATRECGSISSAVAQAALGHGSCQKGTTVSRIAMKQGKYATGIVTAKATSPHRPVPSRRVDRRGARAVGCLVHDVEHAVGGSKIMMQATSGQGEHKIPPESTTSGCMSPSDLRESGHISATNPPPESARTTQVKSQIVSGKEPRMRPERKQKSTRRKRRTQVHRRRNPGKKAGLSKKIAPKMSGRSTVDIEQADLHEVDDVHLCLVSSIDVDLASTLGKALAMLPIFFFGHQRTHDSYHAGIPMLAMCTLSMCALEPVRAVAHHRLPRASYVQGSSGEDSSPVASSDATYASRRTQSVLSPSPSVPASVDANKDFLFLLAPSMAQLDRESLRFQDVAQGVAVSRTDDSRAAAVGDLNGDALPDIFVANDLQRNELLLGDGKGNFTAVQSGAAVARKDRSRGAVIADINMDRLPDIFVANNGHNELLLGDGKGNFTAVQSGAAVARKDRSQGAVIADINMDGLPDIFVANDPQRNELLLGDGKGGFTTVQSGAAVARKDRSRGAVIADINMDGLPDIFVANDLQRNELLLGDGKGGFTAVQSGAAVEQKGSSFGAAIADLNEDGLPDIFVANVGRNELLLGDGKGGFTRVKLGAAVARKDPSAGALAVDVNADGWLDIFVVNKNARANELLLSDGKGGFVAAKLGTAVWRTSNSNGAVIADVNQDGLPDIFVANTNSRSNELLLGDNKGSFTAVTSGAAIQGTDDSREAAVGDLNGDGLPDIFVANILQPNELLLNDGYGGFTAVTSGAAVTRKRKSHGAVIADINMDGLPDIFVANNGHNELLLGDGKGNFTAVQSGAAVARKDRSQGAVIADINMDGLPDIFVANDLQRNELLLGDGKGGFTTVQSGAAVARKDRSQGAVIADINMDGLPDIFVANDLQRNELLLGDGKGGFTAVQSGKAVVRKDRSRGAVIADINMDGLPDIFVANAGHNELLLGDGKGEFTRVKSGKAVERKDMSRRAAIGDLNGDGLPDIFVVNTGENDVGEPNELLLGDGKGGFTAVISGAAVARKDHSRGVAIQDFNGDGLPDIFVANRGERNELLLGDGKGNFTAVTSSAAVDSADKSQGVVSQDFNRDGLPDIFVVTNDAHNELLILNKCPKDGFAPIEDRWRIYRNSSCPTTDRIGALSTLDAAQRLCSSNHRCRGIGTQTCSDASSSWYACVSAPAQWLHTITDSCMHERQPVAGCCESLHNVHLPVS
eukprot:SAG25_NODE_265_length_10686_cov_15.394163_3_plen_1904_part_00